MPTFKTIKEMMGYVQNSFVEELSSEEIISIIKEVMREVIIETVYNKYDASYNRRYDDGGFSDITNYNYKIEVNGNYASITMFNDTKGVNTKNDLDTVIYYGNAYDWINSDIYKLQPYPRNWIEETVKKLYESGELVKRLKDRLSKKGIKIVS